MCRYQRRNNIMTAPVPSSTLESAVDSASLSIDPLRRLSALILVANERLFKLQREVNAGVFAANAKACQLPAEHTAATVLMGRWPRLVDEHMQCVLNAGQTYVEILAQTHIEMALVFSDIVSADIRMNLGNQKPKQRIQVDKRVSATLIQFPDRRVAIGAAVSDLVTHTAIVSGDKPPANGKHAA
jgi:hypothetical protein